MMPSRLPGRPATSAERRMLELPVFTGRLSMITWRALEIPRRHDGYYEVAKYAAGRHFAFTTALGASALTISAISTTPLYFRIFLSLSEAR